MGEGAVSATLTTVVCVDVESSTELLHRVGDDAGLASVSRQLERVRERIESYGGDLVKSTDDGFLLTFSSPRQAVGFALASRRAVAQSAPRLRFGINTREVVSAEGDPLGAAVNAAARIAGRAVDDEVLVSDVVRQLVGTVPGLRFVDRGRCRLKGFSERWQLWAAVDSPAGQQTTATVGRVAELGSIIDLVSSLAAGVGRALLFEGEAGIGKTHLVREAVARSRQAGFEIVGVTADELVRRPWVVPRGLLESVGGGHESRARLGQLLDATHKSANHNEDLTYAIVEASVDLIEEMSVERPVVVAVDDLQWADDLSIVTLAAVARRVSVSRFALIGSLRSAPRSPTLDRLVDRMRDGHGTHVRLDSLDEIDVHALASALIGAAPGQALRQRLRATAGNPLYVVELIRSLDDGGFLQVDSGVADVAGGSSPTSLHETLVRPLSSLPPETNELLRLASLLGGSFTLHDIAAITGRSVIDVAAPLREASLAGLIIGDGDRLAFRHDLIREAVYEHMLPAERRDLHRAAGHALAQIRAPTQQVAQQYARGALPGDLEAVGWLERAAIDAIPISSSAAVELLDQAMRLVPEHWQGRPALQARLIEPLGQCGRYLDGEAIAQSVLASAPTPEVEYTALRGLAIVLGSRGDTPHSITALLRASEAAGAPPSEAQQLRCIAAHMSMLLGTTTVAAAQEVAKATLALGLADDDAYSQCHGHQTLGVIATVTGRGLDSLEHLNAAVALLNSGRVTTGTYLNAAMFRALSLIDLDALDDAYAAAQDMRKRAERTGAVVGLPGAYLIAGGARFFAGRWDDALAQLEVGRAIIDETGAAFYALYFDAVLAKIAIHRGNLAGAEQHLAAATKRLADRGTLFGADWVFDAQAEFLAATGDIDAALRIATTVWERTQHIRYFYGYRTRGVHLVRLALAAGCQDVASNVAVELEEAARRSPPKSASRVAVRCRGLVDQNPELMLEAVAQHRDTPARPDLAACCEDAANVLAVCSRRDEAVDLLHESASIYAELQATGDARRVDAALHKLGQRNKLTRAKRRTHGWESLTTMELNVSHLVAEGLTNPEIGARLYISRRTVETHLSHVFRKLDLPSRTHLVAQITRRQTAR